MKVEQAIKEAEKKTSGEIRIIVNRKAKGDPLQAAAKAFKRLGMHKTKQRNGVLILLAAASRGFAILGDEGVHRFVGQDGWDKIRDQMAERFRQNDFAGGLVYAVEEVGKTLAEHFPYEEGDVNELPDEIVVE